MIRIIIILFIISNSLCNGQPVATPLELIIPSGHTKLPYAVNFSPDGEYILTGGDRTAKLWEAKSGRLVYTLGGHQFPLQRVLFSPDNKYILTVTSLEIKLWDFSTGKLIDSFLLDVKKQNIDLYFERFDFDGVQLHTYSFKDLHLAWSILPMQPISELLDNIVLTSTDSLLLEKEIKKPVELILRDNKQIILLNTNAEHGIDNYAVSPNKKFLIVATKDNLVQAWRLLDQQLMQNILLKGPALDIKFSAKNKYALVTGSRMDPFLLNTENWIKNKLPIHPMNLGWAGFSDDEQYLLYPIHQRMVLYDIENQKEFKTFELESAQFHTQRISPDNKYLLTISNDFIIRVWWVETEEEIYTLGGYTNALEGARLSLDGRYLVTWVMPIFRQKYNYTRVWDLQTGTIKYSWPSQSMLTPEFSPDSKSLLIGDKSNSAKVINLLTGNEVSSIESVSEFPNSSFFCKNGKYILYSHEEGFDFWRMVPTPLKLPSDKKIAGLRHLFLNADENKLYTISKNKQLQIWSFPKLEVLNTQIIGHNSYLDISEDGRFLAAADGNEGLEIWDLNKHKKVYDLANFSLINGVQFSPNGEYLAVISRDKTATIIRTVDGKKMPALKDHSGWLSCLDIHPNGKILATGSGDNTAILWDIKTGKFLHRLKGHVGEINNIEFSKDGNRIVTSSIDGAARVWNLSGKEVCTLQSIKENDYICITPDNYFRGSKAASKLVNWKRGQDLYNFEQFDLQFNRPDKVLQQLGQAPASMINDFYKAYQTRLDKTGFKERNFSTKINPPKVKVETDDLPINTTDSLLSILIKAKAAPSNLSLIHI